MDPRPWSRSDRLISPEQHAAMLGRSLLACVLSCLALIACAVLGALGSGWLRPAGFIGGVLVFMLLAYRLAEHRSLRANIPRATDGWDDEEPVTADSIRAAESHASCGMDFMFCAYRWAEDLQDTDGASRCLREMEACAAKSGHWLLCAKTWRELTDDNDAIRRCIEAAERAVETGIMWTMCAVAYRKLLDDDHCAGRCEAQARRQP
jgi:hypothetical protein